MDVSVIITSCGLVCHFHWLWMCLSLLLTMDVSVIITHYGCVCHHYKLLVASGISVIISSVKAKIETSIAMLRLSKYVIHIP